MTNEKDSLFRNKKHLKNLIAFTYLQASAMFIEYCLMYYTKYLEGNFFVNYCSTGISFGLTLVWCNFLSKWLDAVGVLRFIAVVIIGGTALFWVVLKLVPVWLPKYYLEYIIPALLMVIHLQGASIAQYSYHLGVYLFPPLLRGQAFGISNFISRPFGGLSTIIPEYTDDPLIFIFLFSVAMLCFI